MVGSGRSEVARALVGVDRIDSGTIRIGPHSLSLQGKTARYRELEPLIEGSFRSFTVETGK